jgi:hypothetical protein
MSADLAHHGDMMLSIGGGGGIKCRIGAGGEVFSLMRFLASIDHDGCCYR